MFLALAAESVAQAGRVEPLVRAASYCQVAAYAAWAAPAGRELKPRIQGTYTVWLHRLNACPVALAVAAAVATATAAVSCFGCNTASMILAELHIT
jgi:hypothetical protein